MHWRRFELSWTEGDGRVTGQACDRLGLLLWMRWEIAGGGSGHDQQDTTPHRADLTSHAEVKHTLTHLGRLSPTLLSGTGGFYRLSLHLHLVTAHPQLVVLSFLGPPQEVVLVLLLIPFEYICKPCVKSLVTIATHMDLLQKPTLLLAGGVFIAGEDGLDVGWPGNQRHGVLPWESGLTQ